LSIHKGRIWIVVPPMDKDSYAIKTDHACDLNDHLAGALRERYGLTMEEATSRASGFVALPVRAWGSLSIRGADGRPMTIDELTAMPEGFVGLA